MRKYGICKLKALLRLYAGHDLADQLDKIERLFEPETLGYVDDLVEAETAGFLPGCKLDHTCHIVKIANVTLRGRSRCYARREFDKLDEISDHAFEQAH